jgi:uncharacterized RDD family membrane protein YckC
VDDGRRLLSQPQSRETVEAAKAKANAAWAERKAATAAQPGKPSAAPAAGSDRAALAKTANSAAIVGRRLLARLLDSATLGIVGGALLWGVLRSLSLNGQVGPVAEAPPLLLLVILAFVALVPIEALALAFTGTTPGKAWLGLSVRRSDGSKPSILSAWRRSLEVLWRGLAFGIPVISLVTLVVALVQIINQGAARWDTNNGLELRAAPLASGRFQIAAFALVGLWLLLSSDSFPKLVLEIANAPWVFGR